MKTILHLSLAYFVQRPIRLLLTSAATAAAAAMVVWVVSGYDALLNSFDEYAEHSLGRYPLSIAPIGHFSQSAPGAIPTHAHRFVPGEVLEQLRGEPTVAAADPMWTPQLDINPFVPEGEAAIPWAQLPNIRVMATDATLPPFPLLRGRWISEQSAEEPTAVMSLEGAEGYHVDVGGHVLVGNGPDATRVEIVGVIDAPRVSGWSATVAKQQMLTPGVGGLLVSMELAERLTREPRRISFIGVSLHEGTDANDFRFGWAPRLSRYATPCQFQEAHDIEEALDQSATAENVAQQAHMATLVSMLAALFIIFSTLNMGVTERARQLAVLRAVALTRRQTGAIIAIEGLLFGTIGLVVGVAAGAGLMWAALRSAPEFLEEGAVLGRRSLTLSALSAYGGALLASLVPAYRAMRMKPLDALSPNVGRPRSGSRRRPGSWRLGGALLVVYPVLSQVIPYGDDAPVKELMLVGLVCLAAGTILIAPAIVAMVHRVLCDPIARLMRLPPRLLRSQLDERLGGATGTALALTVGLGLFVAIQVWGHSLLGAFVPGTWAPDAVVAFSPRGVSRSTATRMRDVPGVVRAEPFVVEQPRLLHDLTNSAERATVVRQDNVVMLGIDPDAAFGGADPLVALDFGDVERDTVIAQLRSGRACIVPDHFLSETGLNIGDSFDLVPPEDPSTPVSYEIAAAVSLPGWHWQSKPTGFRTRTHRAAALVFASYDQIAADFSFARASHVWLDYDTARTGQTTLSMAAKSLYETEMGRAVAVDEGVNDEPFIRVVTADTIRGLVHHHARQWLWAISRLPLVILVITAIGVLNALLASVRARRWTLGIVRAVGYSRHILVRLVIAEGLLIGLCACALGLGFGTLAGYCGGGMSRYLSFFGGMSQELVFPWSDILPGVCATLALSALASAWPAFSVGHREPLRLLQLGRGAD
ncbi:MAG: FtsX-like permease family protein [Myxococcota bacterium]